MGIIIKMDDYLAQILKDVSFDNFTISELKEYYKKLSKVESDVEARKFVYKQTLRLLKLKALNKKGMKSSRSATYNKTALFYEIEFIIEPIKTNPHIISKSTVLRHSNKMCYNIELEGKLKKYEIDMIAAIGESEEYILLLDIFPEMKTVLKVNYHNARDRSSKLLGKIKAINTVLSLRDQ